MEPRNITKIVRNMNLYKNKIKESDLNENEFEITRYLTKHRDGLSQQELASYLNVDKALVTRMVRHLSELGYVTIEKCLSDSRKKIVKGTELADSLKAIAQNDEIEFYEAIFKVLNAEEQNQLDSLIERIYLESKRLRKTNFMELTHEKEKGLQ